MEKLNLKDHFEEPVITGRGSIRRRSSRYKSKRSSSKKKSSKKKKKELEVGIKTFTFSDFSDCMQTIIKHLIVIIFR